MLLPLLFGIGALYFWGRQFAPRGPSAPLATSTVDADMAARINTAMMTNDGLEILETLEWMVDSLKANPDQPQLLIAYRMIQNRLTELRPKMHDPTGKPYLWQFVNLFDDGTYMIDALDPSNEERLVRFRTEALEGAPRYFVDSPLAPNSQRRMDAIRELEIQNAAN